MELDYGLIVQFGRTIHLKKMLYGSLFSWWPGFNPYPQSHFQVLSSYTTCYLLSKDVNYMAECPGGIKWIRKIFWNRELTDAFLMSNDKNAWVWGIWMKCYLQCCQSEVNADPLLCFHCVLFLSEALFVKAYYALHSIILCSKCGQMSHWSISFVTFLLLFRMIASEPCTCRLHIVPLSHIPSPGL